MKAYNYAIKCHTETNHLYDGKPYEHHLQMVYDTAIKFIHLIPLEDKHNVLSACWLHDVIEDCRQTYNDVLKETNEIVANIVYAVTNEKGKNRSERANQKYYTGIVNTQYARFVKICDRIANVQYSIDTKSGMLEKYKKENSEFVGHLHNDLYNEMFLHLYNLINQ